MSINQTIYQSTQQRLFEYGAYLMALFIISIYLSTSLAIVISVLVGILWLFTVQFRIIPSVLNTSPVTAWALVLYVCFILGISYGDAPRADAFSMLRKYRELLFIPLLACFFTHERYRTWAWKAFVIASVLTLLSSYLMDFGIMEMFRHKTYTLKSRITHSIFIAFFTFFCAHKIFSNKKYVVWYLLLLIAGVINLFFVVNGRTGQLVFIALVPLFAIQRFSKKGLLVSVVVLAVFLALYINFSDKSTRVYKGLADIQAYLKIPFAKTPTNGEIRYVFWEHSMQLVTERPWFGHGTGSFAKEYQRITANKVDTVGNPHNEFLLIAVQLGFLGLFIYAGFLFSQYYYSRTLPDSEKWLAQGLLLTLIVTSLFNSPFLDHTEGHWFATLIALCFAPTQTDNKIWTGYA